MNAKMVLPGLIAGILSSLLCWFPLTVYLPSALLTDLPRANAGLAWGLGLLAILCLLASGAVAARISGAGSRQSAAVCGAVSSSVAALLVYLLVGGAAAGVWGARPLLLFGLNQASSDAQSTQLLLDNVIGIHWWTMLAVWVALITGLVLGALGGFLAGPGGIPDPQMYLIGQIVAVSGVLTAGLGLIISTAFLLALLQSSAQGITRLNLIPLYPLDTVLIFPAVSNFLLMFTSQWLWWHFYQCGLQDTQPMGLQVRLSAILLLVSPLITMVLIFLFFRGPLFFSLYLPLSLLSALCALGILRHVWKNSNSDRTNHLNRHTVLVSAGLGILVFSAGVCLSAGPAGLVDTTLITPMLVPLILGPDQAQHLKGMGQLIRDYYTTYRNTGLLLLLVILPLLAALIGGLVLLLLRILTPRATPRLPVSV